jgi:putative NADH-flavin reductase
VKLALIGATGYVGARVLDEALERGHDLTAIARNLEKLPQHPRLTPLQADVQDLQQIADAVEGHDAVVSCFNPGHDLSSNPHLYRDIVEGTRTMIDAVKQAGVKRLVYVGGAGSLNLRPGVQLIDEPEYLLSQLRNPPAGMVMPVRVAPSEAPPPGPPTFDVPRGVRMAYVLFEREPELEWTFVSPSLFLGDYGGRTGRHICGGDDLLMEKGVPAGIDVADFAVAIIDEVEQPRRVHGHLTAATPSA